MSTLTAPLPEVSRVRELDLVDKVAVISGASRGIGRAIAFNLASRGCSILGTCTSDASATSISSALNDEITSRVFDTTSRMRPASLRIIGLVADIFSHICASIIADGISKFFNGRVDIFVNCASDPIPGIIGEMGANEVQRSKSAGESLCRTWAHAFGGKEERYSFMEGTTANAVTVGLTETDAVVNCGPQAVRQFQDEFFPSQSIPRFGQPDDVADVVGLLCSSDARWITGCVVSASGGGIKIG
ncbi:hypothetical protein CJF32_00007126 [Rutstroemia sp. NJR-2017a WRK4]|nr:hypothetical protein CJF32_00007126 [Rutstroemia sp. NJR-2017a WRK4]